MYERHHPKQTYAYNFNSPYFVVPTIPIFVTNMLATWWWWIAFGPVTSGVLTSYLLDYSWTWTGLESVDNPEAPIKLQYVTSDCVFPRNLCCNQFQSIWRFSISPPLSLGLSWEFINDKWTLAWNSIYTYIKMWAVITLISDESPSAWITT